MTELWMPEAIRKEIPKHRRGPRPYNNRCNYHVAVSEGLSLYAYFSGAGVCSHAYVRKDGTIEQYLPLNNYSAADLDGNDATFSVETQGGVAGAQGEPWTDAQIISLAKIAVFVHQQVGILLRLAISSKVGEESKGLSWHRLGIDGNFPALPSILAGRLQRGGGMRYSKSAGKICPGNAKIEQMPQILARALEIIGGAVPTTPTVPPVVIPAHAPIGNGGGVKNWLQKGDTGPAVRNLQALLNGRGYRLAVDGSFGAKTQAAVRAFQMATHLVIDGLAGPATMAALQASAAPAAPKPVPAAAGSTTVLRRGSAGEAVRVLQRTLNRDYPAYSRLVTDGLFGPATEAVVYEFQRRAGITVDGLVGPQTRRALGI